jgi:hypothetical protein
VRRSQEGFAFEYTGTLEQRAKFLERLVTEGLRPIELAAEETDLEDLFLELTKGELQ